MDVWHKVVSGCVIKVKFGFLPSLSHKMSQCNFNMIQNTIFVIFCFTKIKTEDGWGRENIWAAPKWSKPNSHAAQVHIQHVRTWTKALDTLR